VQCLLWWGHFTALPLFRSLDATLAALHQIVKAYEGQLIEAKKHMQNKMSLKQLLCAKVFVVYTAKLTPMCVQG
jgi:hypothetical protein